MKTGILAMMAVGALSFAGCVQYDGISMAGDDLDDTANQSFASEAQNAYLARMNAPKRPVVIREAPGMNLFLSPQAAGQELAVRKEATIAFKSRLREKIAGLKDFQLVEENQPAISVASEKEIAPSPNYLMTYNITSLELRPAHVMQMRQGQSLARWEAKAKVEVRLFKPNATDCIFSFVGDGAISSQMIDASLPPPRELLLGAVSAAADTALEDYVVKFGPPIYVTETCQNGQFARLSVGAKFGVRRGQKVEFFRNRVRAGLSGQAEVSRQVVGTGIVGARHAPVEDDAAWVFVENYDPRMRNVFRWTSARILSAENSKDNGFLQF